MSGIIGVIVVLVLVAVVFIALYNGLVRLKVLTENAWSDVDVQLKKRRDLVPNLVETVKGYARHEQDTLQQVIHARNQAAAAPNPGAQIEAENALTGALRQLFALSEAYPDLKANTNFHQLQNELSQIERDIANARRYYNATVRDYNTKQLTFPGSIVAGMGNFDPRPFYEADDAEREPVQVQF